MTKNVGKLVSLLSPFHKAGEQHAATTVSASYFHWFTCEAVISSRSWEKILFMLNLKPSISAVRLNKLKKALQKNSIFYGNLMVSLIEHRWLSIAAVFLNSLGAQFVYLIIRWIYPSRFNTQWILTLNPITVAIPITVAYGPWQFANIIDTVCSIVE